MITLTHADNSLATIDPFQDNLTHDERNLLVYSSSHDDLTMPNCGSRMPLSRVKARINEYLD